MPTRDLIREHLLSALHVARLSPGARVPSVRRMAQLTGLDRKTVHRAYLRLVTEGLLVTRPGSGTFIAPDPTSAGGPDPVRLVDAAGRFREFADDLGLDPEVFARFLERMGGRRLEQVQVAVVECNHEQSGLIARELSGATGARTRAVLIEDLPDTLRLATRAIDAIDAIVTTECHREEVQAIAAPYRLPVFRAALDFGHAEALLRYAARGHVVMVVRDLRFEAAFRRLLGQLAVPEPLRRRVVMIEARDLERTFRTLDPPVFLHVSPLFGPEPARLLPPGWRRIGSRRYTDAGSLDLLRAQFALLDARREVRPPAVVPRTSREGAGPASLTS